MPTGNQDLTIPEKGTTDWHVPLNDNFGHIEQRVRSLANSLDVAVTIDLAKPAKGTTDWHVPLNDNFQEIDDAVRTLGSAAGVADVGGYSQPTKGTTDWHVPLNDNFGRIETELRAIADAASAERLLEIITTTDDGTGIQYEFVVAAGGAAEKTTGRNSDVRAGANDTIDVRDDGTTLVTGTTGDLMGDAFLVTGDLSSFERTGGYDAAEVYLDGVDVTDDLLGDDADPEPPQTSGPSGDNFVYVSAGQLERAAKLVDDGRQPFVAAHNRLINDADRALNANLESVTDDDGKHVFLADINNRHDYRAAIRMKNNARDCALAYWFTGDDAYARKAVDIIHHWCLKRHTFMEPTMVVPNTSGSIEQLITIPGFVYAASLVRGHPRWDDYGGSRPWDGGNSSDAESAFRRWASDWIGTEEKSRPGYCMYANKWAWRTAAKAACAAYLGDDALLDLARRMWRAEAEVTCDDGSTRLRPWHDYRDVNANNGFFKRDRSRNNGFSYTGYNLLALALTPTILDAWDGSGSNLWNFNAPTDGYSGPTFRKALNWYEPYTRDTSSWRWNSGESISNGDIEEACAAFELAHAAYDDFDAAIDNPDRIGGRPHQDRRLLGPVTLTHGAP